jgi:hypothetical protein
MSVVQECQAFLLEFVLSVCTTFRYSSLRLSCDNLACMSESLTLLANQRSRLLERIVSLKDFRPGSISATVRKCGKPGCRCARTGDPGHGPNYRLTYKAKGKTFTEVLPDQETRRKAEREVAEYRKFQKLVADLVNVSATICRIRAANSQRAVQRFRR